MSPESLHATVIVIDGGGRGHALAEKYAESPHVGKVIVIPGHDFIAQPTKPIISYQNLKTTDVGEIVRLCQEEQKENLVLVDVAQDDAVAAGVANATRDAGILTVGPSREAGRIEWDKEWSRELMERAGVLQPVFKAFTSSQDGEEYI